MQRYMKKCINIIPIELTNVHIRYWTLIKHHKIKVPDLDFLVCFSIFSCARVNVQDREHDWSSCYLDKIYKSIRSCVN